MALELDDLLASGDGACQADRVVLVATFASLRWGELIALRRRDVDLDTLTVDVERAIVENDGSFIVGPPKSDAGKRGVPVLETIAPDLDSHLRWFAQKGKNGLLFVGPRGATPRRCNFVRIWHKALAAANVPRMHLHDLRHTAALGYLHKVQDRDRAIAEGLDELVKEVPRDASKKKRDGRRKRAG